MTEAEFRIADERAEDAPAVAALSARVFGPGRFARSAYRVREQGSPAPALSLAGWRGETLSGAIRFTPIAIGGQAGALLLGPLAIAPEATGRGLGRALVTEGAARAARFGWRLVLLVGDMPYYGRFGFTPTSPGRITLPGPADPTRLLALELQPGAMQDYEGQVRAI
jgi:predicted N-acetyltransferase YhbS